MQRIGIFGGSFDPIHTQHVALIKASLEQLQLDRILVIPTANNPWKDSSGANKQERLDMLEIALKVYPKVEICRYEIDQETDEKNYTIDTINYLKNIYPHDQLFFIMGLDQASSFHKWKDAKAISELVQLVAFNRLGYQANENLTTYHFIQIDFIATKDSSSDIRDGKLQGLDPAILKYIVSHGIYLDTMIKSRMSSKRYQHTLSMANLAKEIAKSNGLDEVKAYVAGMLHDVAKEMDYHQAKAIMEEHYAMYLDKPEPVWHQWLSQEVAKNEFLVDDVEILQAIRHHTTASLTMSKLDMCIYVADKYDPNRDFDSSKEITLCKKDVVAGFKQCLKDFYDFSTLKKRPIDQCFFEIYDKYVKGDLNE